MQGRPMTGWRGLQNDDRKKSEKQTAPEAVSSLPSSLKTQQSLFCFPEGSASPKRYLLHELHTCHLDVGDDGNQDNLGCSGERGTFGFQVHETQG